MPKLKNASLFKRTNNVGALLKAQNAQSLIKIPSVAFWEVFITFRVVKVFERVTFERKHQNILKLMQKKF